MVTAKTPETGSDARANAVRAGVGCAVVIDLTGLTNPGTAITAIFCADTAATQQVVARATAPIATDADTKATFAGLGVAVEEVRAYFTDVRPLAGPRGATAAATFVVVSAGNLPPFAFGTLIVFAPITRFATYAVAAPSGKLVFANAVAATNATR